MSIEGLLFKIVFPISLTLLVGCGHQISNPMLLDRVHTKDSSSSEITNPLLISLPGVAIPDAHPLKIEFLGVGGFAFEYGDHRIITAPFYSNQRLYKSFNFGTISSDKGLVHSSFPWYLADSTEAADRNVQAILVGHSHYDHLLDVPTLMKNELLSAKAFGSQTMAAILKKQHIATDGDKSRVVIVDKTDDHRESLQLVNKDKCQSDMNWTPIGDGSIRILPIISIHAPHLFGYTAQKGFYDTGDKITLDHPSGWRMGEVYAYIIDILDDDDSVLYRIYYQDSASDIRKDVFQDLEVQLKGRKIDIAILTVAGAHNAEPQYLPQDNKAGYPNSLLIKLNADLYILGHWEDFFAKPGSTLKASIATKEEDFTSDLEKAIAPGVQWVMPSPGRKISIQRQ